jgi:hypothetical protein
LLGLGARVRAGRLGRPRLWDDVLLGVGGAVILLVDKDSKRSSASLVSVKVCNDGFDRGSEARGAQILALCALWRFAWLLLQP